MSKPTPGISKKLRRQLDEKRDMIKKLKLKNEVDANDIKLLEDKINKTAQGARELSKQNVCHKNEILKKIEEYSEAERILKERNQKELDDYQEVLAETKRKNLRYGLMVEKLQEEYNENLVDIQRQYYNYKDKILDATKELTRQMDTLKALESPAKTLIKKRISEKREMCFQQPEIDILDKKIAALQGLKADLQQKINNLTPPTEFPPDK